MNTTLFETIKIEDGQIFNLDWHNRRFKKSQKEFFSNPSTTDLKAFITPPKTGLYRCKITYDTKIQSVEYFPYQAKTFKNFKIISSQLEYTYKQSDRSEFQNLLNGYEEIIIEKNGLLTDTTIANIAFFDGGQWLTPRTPLLEGTTRARLLEEGFLKLENIKKESIKKYTHFALMNAMIGFQIQKDCRLEFDGIQQ
jgi:4-amino-4-deoxychorismate lyase